MKTLSQQNLIAAVLSLAVCAGAQAMDPGSPEARSKSQSLTNTGFNFMLSKDYAGAQTYFERALAIEPNLAMAHLDLGTVYQNTGRHAAATEQFDLAIADDTKANDYAPVRETTDGSSGTVTEIANRNLEKMRQADQGG